jgi:hypothetical protein
MAASPVEIGLGRAWACPSIAEGVHAHAVIAKAEGVRP